MDFGIENVNKLTGMTADKQISQIKASVGRGRYRVIAEVKLIGNDIVLLIWGGTKPHIGSISVSIPRPSLKDPQNISATSSVFNFISHKDESVARIFSEKIAAAFNRNTVATAGIHVDKASETDLEKILRNAEDLCSVLINRLERLYEKA